MKLGESEAICHLQDMQSVSSLFLSYIEDSKHFQSRFIVTKCQPGSLSKILLFTCDIAKAVLGGLNFFV